MNRCTWWEGFVVLFCFAFFFSAWGDLGVIAGTGEPVEDRVKQRKGRGRSKVREEAGGNGSRGDGHLLWKGEARFIL